MIIQLSPSIVLTDERAECRYGIPVCVNRQDDSTAYGPADVAKLYPSFGWQPVAHTVRRLVKTAKLSDEEREKIRLFLGQWPDGPQLEE